MLLDDAGDPDSRTLEMMAVAAIARGWQGRALAHHCRAMALYPAPTSSARRASRTAARRGGHRPAHRAAACAGQELLAEGVVVCLGQDDISDAYYTFGRNNMLEVAFLAAHLLWMMTRTDVAAALRHDDARRRPSAINLPKFGLAVGEPANLVGCSISPDEVEALREHAPPAHVISHGKIVDAAAMARLARA